jgi:putative transposase
MIRTHVIPCDLPRNRAAALNLESGRVYTGVLVAHWRTVRRKGFWLSEKSATRWSDTRTRATLHAHTIDAAQQGFYKACVTTRALRKAGFADAKFPHWTKKFRTTVWKNTAIRRRDDALVLSNGAKNPKVFISIPTALRDALRFLEVRLVYDKKARHYAWHLVIENGKQPKVASGDNVVSVDPGEIHPAVVGDEAVATVITCRERRAESQGHAKRLTKIQAAASRKTKGSRRHRRLMRAKSRMKAKHNRVMRDMEHKISRAIVNAAVERGAGTIVIGDVRDIADWGNKGKVQNGRMSRWNHGKVRAYVEYKAKAEGITVKLVDEHHTSQTCPNCTHRHKPKGRNFRCPACGFQAHRDAVGQVNILSVFRHGEPGKIPAPSVVKYRIPHNLRAMRRCRDTGLAAMPVAREQSREAVGF